MRLLVLYIMSLSPLITLAHAQRTEGDVSAISFDTTGKLLAIGKNGGDLSIYDRNSDSVQWSHEGAGPQILEVFFRNNNSELVALERRGRILFFESQTGRLKKTLLPYFGYFTIPSMDAIEKRRPARLYWGSIDRGGKILALANDLSPTVYFIDLDEAKKENETLVLTDRDTFKVTDGTSAVFVNISKDQTSLSVKTELIGNSSGGLKAFEFSIEQNTALGSTGTTIIDFWKLDNSLEASEGFYNSTPRKFRKTNYGDIAVAISTENHFLSVCYTEKYGGTQLWELSKGELIAWDEARLPGGVANRAIFSHSGKYAVASDEFIAHVWEVSNNKLVRFGKIMGWQGGILDRPNAVAFSPDDTILAVAIEESIALIDVEKKNLFKYIPAPPKNGSLGWSIWTSEGSEPTVDAIQGSDLLPFRRRISSELFKLLEEDANQEQPPQSSSRTPKPNVRD